MDPNTASAAFTETLSSTGAAGGATACAECLTSFGVDPMIAGPIAVLVGVGVRLLVDWAQRRLAARKLTAESPSSQPGPKS